MDARGLQPRRREEEPEERRPEKGQRQRQMMSQIEDEQQTQVRRHQRQREGGRPQPRRRRALTMSFPWAPALLALYYSVLVVLSFFGLHRLMLVVIYLRTRGPRVAARRSCRPIRRPGRWSPSSCHSTTRCTWPSG